MDNRKTDIAEQQITDFHIYMTNLTTAVDEIEQKFHSGRADVDNAIMLNRLTNLMHNACNMMGCHRD